MEKSIMWKYIYEEADILTRLMESSQVSDLTPDLRFGDLDKVIFIASGSSINIAKVSQKLYEDLAGVSVCTETPFHFMRRTKAGAFYGCRDNALVIAISQTGTSSGTINAINRAKELGLRVLTITEREDTAVQRLGDYYLNFMCGLEDCNAKTKGYSSSLVLLWQLALAIGKAKGILTEQLISSFTDEIMQSISDIPSTIEETLRWLKGHKDWSRIEHVFVTGYGINYGTAEEGMLKLTETLCKPATLCEAGEFAHGFHRAVSKDSNVISILTDEYGYEDMVKINAYLSERISRLLVINASQISYDNPAYINIACHPMTASALNIAVVFQVMAAYLPELNGRDPNIPSNNELTDILSVRV